MELSTEIDELVMKIENLIDDRPYLLLRIKLKISPNNVVEWKNLAQLYVNIGGSGSDGGGGSDSDVCNVLLEAISTIQPQKAEGKVSTLYTYLARVYASQGLIEVSVGVV